MSGRTSHAVAATLHTLEGLTEQDVFASFGLGDDDVNAVLEETGIPPVGTRSYMDTIRHRHYRRT